MKRLSLVLMSVALMLGMAQCKKNAATVVPGGMGEPVNITLKVNGDSKVVVTPGTGAVTFEDGDKIYVASDGHYVGTLTYGSGSFSGSITGPTSGKPLYFYFMGNQTPTETLAVGSTSTLTVSIYDQTSGYPVISAAPSVENYSADLYTYTSVLMNRCALVKFNVTTSSSAPTIITGVNDKVSVSFSNSGVGTFVPSQSKGAIKLAAGSGEKWAIMLPSDEVVSDGQVAYSADLLYNGTCGEIAAINNNDYLTDGITVTVSTDMPKFSVAAGTQVRFASGNLQYQSSTQTWRFAENQYDIIGNTTANRAPTSGQEGWMDLFSWGRWTGADADAVTPASGTVSFTDFNHSTYSISNGYGKNWRTVTNDEHGYLFNTRTGCSTINGVENARYSKATVAGRFGVMIFPDSFSWPEGVSLPTANAINQIGNYTAGSYDAAAWTKLEANGAVFFPAAGNRNNGSVAYSLSWGYYRVSTRNGADTYAVIFYVDIFYPQDNYGKSYGASVRLVF